MEVCDILRRNYVNYVSYLQCDTLSALDIGDFGLFDMLFFCGHTHFEDLTGLF